MPPESFGNESNKLRVWSSRATLRHADISLATGYLAVVVVIVVVFVDIVSVVVGDFVVVADDQEKDKQDCCASPNS
jgi:hypothetical protein